jgi:hypothetical protein
MRLLLGDRLAAGRRFASAPKEDCPATRTNAKIGVRGNEAVRRLANTVTFCDGHGVFFAAASGQFRGLWRK